MEEWNGILLMASCIETNSPNRDRPTEYQNIITAWRSITAILDVEEEWDSLVQNYIELEMALLQSAMHSMVLNHGSYHEYQDVRLGFARKLSNLLQTCRSYLDHTPHNLHKIEGGSYSDQFAALTRTAHARHFGYRFMDALRNYAQHRGLPLHGASFNSSWTGDVREGDKGLLQYSVAANVNLSEIRRDKKFSAKVLAEVDELQHLDIATLTREYIEGLGGVHEALREVLKEALTGWKATVRDAIARYAAANNRSVLGLCVAEFDDRDTVKDRTSIFDDMLLRAEMMMRRNGSLVNLKRRYVTNEIISPKKPDSSKNT